MHNGRDQACKLHAGIRPHPARAAAACKGAWGGGLCCRLAAIMRCTHRCIWGRCPAAPVRSPGMLCSMLRLISPCGCCPTAPHHPTSCRQAIMRVVYARRAAWGVGLSTSCEQPAIGACCAEASTSPITSTCCFTLAAASSAAHPHSLSMGHDVAAVRHGLLDHLHMCAAAGNAACCTCRR